MYDSHLVKWSYFGNYKVKLLYDDGSELLVFRSDFDRAFMCFLVEPKSAIERDFAISEKNSNSLYPGTYI